MDSAEQQVVDHLKQARNILVTVRNSPTADLLSACIGLALALDKMDKHVAAVFSGEVPSTLEFLKPEETIEQNPDSLRDFIIALDKSKADKLRYKVEDKVVRIFITPYKTSLSQDDLQFSQGDFNVDAVVALGAHEQQELDQAITAHGRILHDATVISINNTPNGSLGSVNWQDTSASSISELVTKLVKDLNKSVLDDQIATALLTGIVAETDRFSNEKTTPRTMSLAGDLMAAGANQQLVSTQLQTDSEPSIPDKPNADFSTVLHKSAQPMPPKPSKTDDGALKIDHKPWQENEDAGSEVVESADQMDQPSHEPELGQNRDMLPIPEPPRTNGLNDDPFSSEFAKDSDKDKPSVGHSFLVDEPTLPETPQSESALPEPSGANPFDLPPKEPSAPLLSRDEPADTRFSFPAPPPPIPSAPEPTTFSPPALPYSPAPEPIIPPNSNDTPESTTDTLEEIEESVHSPHLISSQPADVDSARHEVMQALQSSTPPIEPLAALNANPLGDELHANQVEIDANGNIVTTSPPSAPATPVADTEPDESTPLDMPLPTVNPAPPATSQQAPISTTSDSPPPVPPPFMPPPNFVNPN